MSERFDYDGLLEVNQALRAENARLREALERVLEQWVNGRKVKDGICMEVLVVAQAALTPAGGGNNVPSL